MDTYRIGTLLEMVRELAYSLADVGLNTRILIQPSMGQGIFKSLPLALSGVMNIMQGMDWEDGLVGEHVNFGAVIIPKFLCRIYQVSPPPPPPVSMPFSCCISCVAV